MMCGQESEPSTGTLVTPPRNDTRSFAFTRGRSCGTSGSHHSMMSGGDVIVTSSIDETSSEFAEADAMLGDMIVSVHSSSCVFLVICFL